MPLLYPDRKRIIPVRGFGAYSRIENRDTNGDEVYTGILRTGFKIEKIKKEVVQQDRKKDSIDYLYLVMIGENPSNGIFNIEVIKNENKPYGSSILAVGVDNLEIGLKLKEVNLTNKSFPYEYYDATRFLPIEGLFAEAQKIEEKELELDLI
jgi:hypothetical protein